MSKAHQTSEQVNMGRSGGVNHQGAPMSLDVPKPDDRGAHPAAAIPPKGVSNGGK